MTLVYTDLWKKIDACQSTTGKPKPLRQQNLVRHFLYHFNCILTTVYFILFTLCLLTSATPKSEIFSVPSVAKSKFPGLICRYCQGNQSIQILTVPVKF